MRRSGSAGSSTRQRPVPRTGPPPGWTRPSGSTHASASGAWVAERAGRDRERVERDAVHERHSLGVGETPEREDTMPARRRPRARAARPARAPSASPSPACPAGSRTCARMRFTITRSFARTLSFRSSRWWRCCARCRPARGRSSRASRRRAPATALSFVSERVVEGELVVGQARVLAALRAPRASPWPARSAPR